MKTKMEIQYKNKNVGTVEIEKTVKEALKAQGVKMNTIDILNIYYQPENKAIYYLATLTDGKEIKSEAIEVE